MGRHIEEPAHDDARLLVAEAAELLHDGAGIRVCQRRNVRCPSGRRLLQLGACKRRSHQLLHHTHRVQQSHDALQLLPLNLRGLPLKLWPVAAP